MHSVGYTDQKAFGFRIRINELVHRDYAWCTAREKALVQAACALVDNDELLNRGLSIAKILSTFTLDVNLLIVGLVYESFCKGRINSLRIEQVLGFAINELVLGLKKLELMLDLDLRDVNKNEIAAKKYCNDSLDILLAVMKNDIRIISLKLAIHLHAMRISNHADERTRLSLAHQAQGLYAPLTKRLNLGEITWRLEDLAFKLLHPEKYKEIAALLDEVRVERENYILKTKKQLERCLKLYNIDAEVCGRPKHIYSIWCKMQRKIIDYNEIHDVHALRIIVPDVKSCFVALKVVHALWRHLDHELDDYISNPKSNGYASLHTAVIGPDGKVLEVQIRSTQMNQEAEFGVAAHWRYKMRAYELIATK